MGVGGGGGLNRLCYQHSCKRLEADTSTIVMAPMPGMLKSVDVEVEQEVSYWGEGGGGG